MAIKLIQRPYELQPIFSEGLKYWDLGMEKNHGKTWSHPKGFAKRVKGETLGKMAKPNKEEKKERELILLHN